MLRVSIYSFRVHLLARSFVRSNTVLQAQARHRRLFIHCNCCYQSVFGLKAIAFYQSASPSTLSVWRFDKIKQCKYKCTIQKQKHNSRDTRTHQQKPALFARTFHLYIFIETEKQVHKLIAFLPFLNATCVYHDMFFAFAQNKKPNLSTTTPLLTGSFFNDIFLHFKYSLSFAR